MSNRSFDGRAARAAAIPVLLLIAGLLLDLVPRFALGDSGSYLSSEWGGYLPEDRSWVYGLVAAFVTQQSRDLATMALLQIVLAWGSAILVAESMARRFGLGVWFRIAAVAVLFCGPLTYYWAHGFMTDSLAATAFGALCALLIASLGTVVTALGVLVLATLIGALRSVYLPPLLVAVMAVAAICAFRAVRTARAGCRAGDGIQSDLRGTLRFGTISAAVLAAMLANAAANAWALIKPNISANYAAARFLVSAWSPVLGPAVEKLALPPEVTQGMVPLTYDNRLEAAFSDNGLVARLRDYFKSDDSAESAFKFLVKSAIVDNPLRFVALVARSWSDYINPSLLLKRHHERWMTGTNDIGTTSVLDPPLISRLQGWGIWQGVSPTLPRSPSFGLTYLSSLGGYWAFILALHATLAGAAYLFLPGRRHSDDVLAIQLFASAYMAMLAATTNALVTRYLMPLDVPLLLTLALGGSRGAPGWLNRPDGLPEEARRPPAQT